MEKKLKELAIIKERQRIAREFHDGVGSKLVSIVMQCDFLQDINHNHQIIKDEICSIKESASESIDDMRRSIAFLNGDFDIKEQIDLMTEKIRCNKNYYVEKKGIEILQNLNFEQQIACCRITQEALTNAIKHAGGGKILVSAEHIKNIIVLNIEDDGCGFDPQIDKKHHYGIKNMIERANQIGGRLICTSTPQLGTKISLEIAVA
jgi:signal transduction histidine kinase